MSYMPLILSTMSHFHVPNGLKMGIFTHYTDETPEVRRSEKTCQQPSSWQAAIWNPNLG